jgi:hypothetical protein
MNARNHGTARQNRARYVLSCGGGVACASTEGTTLTMITPGHASIRKSWESKIVLSTECITVEDSHALERWNDEVI